MSEIKQITLAYRCPACQDFGEYVCDENLRAEEIKQNFLESHHADCMRRQQYARKVSDELCRAFIDACEESIRKNRRTVA